MFTSLYQILETEVDGNLISNVNWSWRKLDLWC